MGKRIVKKVLKRAGYKLHNDLPLSLTENKYLQRESESKISKAINQFRNGEFEKGTIYDSNYIAGLTKVINKTLTIENITGVKK